MGVARPHHSFVSVLDGASFAEHAILEGKGEARVTGTVPPWVRARKGAVAGVRGALGRALHWLARGLYLAPALIVAKILLAKTGAPSDYVTVAFVILVVAFFVVLDLYLFVSVVWWFGRGGEGKLRFVLPSGPDATGRVGAADPATASPGDRVLARGRVVSTGPEGEGVEVLRDLWAPGARQPTRVVEVADFAIVADGQPTVVVRCEWSPGVVAPAERTDGEAWLLGAGDATRTLVDSLGGFPGGSAVALAIRPGDEVEAIGRFLETIPDPLPEPQSGAPYRRAGAAGAVLVGEIGEQPVRIVRLG